MRKARTTFVALAVLLILANCDSNFSEKALVNVEMLATSGTSTIAEMGGRLAAGDSIALTEAIIGVTRLEFEPADEDDDHEFDDHSGDDDGDDHDNSGPGSMHDGDHDDNDDADDGHELEFKGEFVVDLINGTSTPDFGIDQVVPGTYDEIEAKLSPILEDSNSIFIKATVFAGDGAQYNIEYSNQFRIELEIESENGIKLTDGLNSILVLINLDDLFSGIDFSTAQVDADNVIRINSTSNKAIAAMIATNFDSAVKCGEDRDGDHDIDD